MSTIQPVPRRSVSDDDLCAACKACDYKPGESSECFSGWPGKQDADGYVTECVSFTRAERVAS